MKKNKKKKARVHLKLKPILILFFFVGLLIGSGYYVYHLPIKNIIIKGTSYLKDKELLEALDLKNYPRMYKYSTKTLLNKLNNFDLVESATIKKSLDGRLVIDIKEAKPLFYNRSDYCYVLSNGKTTNELDFSGIPFLINYVPNQIMERLVKEFSALKDENIALISEIEYSPSIIGEIVIDDTRFLLRMNDGNEVYINLINTQRLDTYPLIYTLFTE